MANFRIIGKVGFLLVVMGFFMPWANIVFIGSLNGFDAASLAGELGEAGLEALVYLWFVSALAGVVIGVLLLMKKNVPVGIDWLLAIVCLIGPIVVLAENDGFLMLEAGFYATLIGAIVAVAFQAMSVAQNGQGGQTVAVNAAAPETKVSAERQILTLSQTSSSLSLRQIVSQTSLEIDEVEDALKQLVAKGMAKEQVGADGKQTYDFS